MINSQLTIISQGNSYLESISNEHYQAILAPNFISSSGSHIRHIIDHYLAIIHGLKENKINYDKRDRDGEIELQPELALIQFDVISSWLQQLSEKDLTQRMILSTEVSITNKNIQQVQTSLARELVFAGSHAVHHYAMIAQIAFAQQLTLPNNFGLAPATATFLRKNVA